MTSTINCRELSSARSLSRIVRIARILEHSPRPFRGTTAWRFCILACATRSCISFILRVNRDINYNAKYDLRAATRTARKWIVNRPGRDIGDVAAIINERYRDNLSRSREYAYRILCVLARNERHASTRPFARFSRRTLPGIELFPLPSRFP